MEIKKTRLKDCLIIEPKIFEDQRGFFYETYHLDKYKNIANIDYKFVQDNLSSSKKNVLRGLHFQKKKPQGKIVRVIKGEVFDVAVDLRVDSDTFGKWESHLLSEINKKQYWIPPGFAHGFLVISEEALVEYKCTDFYDPDDEGSIIWNDPSLNIDWPLSNPIVSIKDSEALSFDEIIK